MTVRLMHLADVHLGAPLAYLGDKAGQRGQELESAFARALALAPEKGVHAVLVAGDLFDSFDPAADLVARVKGLFQKVTGQGIAVILLPGTHDSHRYPRSVYAREDFPGVDILLETGKPVQKHLNGRDVRFYGYSGSGPAMGDRPPFRRGEAGELHVALVHGSVTEGSHWSSSTRDYDLRPSDLEGSGFHYVALGHHHSFQEIKVGATVAVYPGTLEGVKFGENGDRSLVVAEIDENTVIIETTEHNQRTISEIAIDLSILESTEDLVNEIVQHADSEGITRVSLTGTANFVPAVKELEAQLADRFFFLQIADETSIYRSEIVRSVMHEETVRGIFARKMLERIEHSSDDDRPGAELALRLGMAQFIGVDDANQ